MLKVLKSGFLSSIQDKGRFGFADKGVPISGAMDAYSAYLANAILNNAETDAVLEITLGNCKFQFLASTTICITGGDFTPKLNGTTIQLNKIITIFKTDILTFTKVNYGVRCYLAVKGGFLTEQKMGSRSYYSNITNSNSIHKGDVLPYHELKEISTKIQSSIKINKNHYKETGIACYKGPEYYSLDDKQKKFLQETTFTISKDNSRMGYKLNELLVNELPQLLTSSVFPGTVQLTKSGSLIVLMRDCQTTGGYPRILQLTEQATNQLAQKTSSDSFKFKVKLI